MWPLSGSWSTNAGGPSAPSSSSPSGHYRARYFYQGVFHNAPETYRTVTDANSWLTVEEAKILQGTWVPVAGTAMTVFQCWCSRYSAVLLGVRKQHGGICRTSNTYHSGYSSLMPSGKQEKALHWSLSLEECSPAPTRVSFRPVSSPGKYRSKSDTRDSRVYVTLAPFKNNAEFLGK